ncbi:lysophospholipid acyltransferase family protein [Nonlabens sp. Ci31]|jgi:KDO2-lipid IV(A) lauroyltransferase|uniref:lysophospholipid acyltransferase family protein n=1 Tax=Nonlabens sp. Ci31 TaxID=2608253 RepID=UPI0014640B29|nr:lysophospholipid acyltransferase family protein [Nonlabens sp. Ci31]QJP35538.1 lysophospholipid acyltransferase family protein [Nonlabens sp. Ci31]
MQAVAFYLIYPILWIISRLPFSIVYLLSDFFYFVTYYVIGYRKGVIKNNLRIAFPKKNEKEITRLAKKSTQHFCDIFIEMIKSMGMSEKSMKKRFTCSNPEMVNAFAKANQPIIAMFGHQASYEWTMVLDNVLDYKVYAIYKPLKNKRLNNLIVNIRKKFNSELVAMKKATAVMSKSAETEAALFALVADQSPKAGRAQYFTSFFNVPSAVFKGAERIAKEYHTAVVFLKVAKVKRGYYETEFVTITPNGAETKDWEITDTFFQLLEEQIIKQPEYYLWSHKRWKSNLGNTTRAVELSPRVQL